MERTVIMAMNSFRVGGSQTYAITLAGLLKSAGYEPLVMAKPGPLRPPVDTAIRSMRTLWQEGMEECTQLAWKRLPIRLAEHALLMRLRFLAPPHAILVSQPWPTRFMVRARDRLWPNVPVFGLVHGFLPVEFPPAGGQRSIDGVQHWFATTHEALSMLSKKCLAASLLGNIFAGHTFWGSPPAPLQPRGIPTKWLFCGTLTSNKVGPLRCLIGALSDFKDAQLTIAGDGDQRKYLEAISKQQHVADRVTFLGAVVDVRPHILAADCIIAGGRAAIEAGSGGRPVVVATTEGLHGVLRMENLPIAERSNFTGRSSLSVGNSTQAIAEAILSVPSADRAELQSLQENLWSIGDVSPLVSMLDAK